MSHSAAVSALRYVSFERIRFIPAFSLCFLQKASMLHVEIDELAILECLMVLGT